MKKFLAIILTVFLLSSALITFSACGKDGTPTPPEKSLEYQLNEDKQSYSVAGIGNVTDSNIVIPENYKGLPVNCIADNAFFACSNIESVEILADITKIGEYAFYNCVSLVSIEIPATVQGIGDRAFNGCIRLVEVINRSTYFTVEKGSMKNGEIGCFALGVYNGQGEYNSKVSADEKGYVTYTENDKCVLVDYVGKEVNIVIPKRITEINARAFMNYMNISTVSVEQGSKLEKLGSQSFRCALSLKTVDLKNATKLKAIEDLSFYYCDVITSVELPNGLETISYMAFGYCSGIKSIVLPASITYMGEYVFFRCLTTEKIYCGAESQPSTWHNDWNLLCSGQLIWNSTGEEV